MGRIRYDLNIVLRQTVKCSTLDQFKVIQEDTKLIKTAEQGVYSLRMVWLHLSHVVAISMLTLQNEPNEQRKNHTLNNVDECTRQHIGLICDSRKTKDRNFADHEQCNHTVWFCADRLSGQRCLKKCGRYRSQKIQLMQKPGEILCERKEALLRWEPVMDQRFDGVPKKRDRQALISHLVNQVINSSKKKELMEELFPTRQIIKDQGNVEAFELFELSNEVQCKHGHGYTTSSHVHCCCGRTFVYANPNLVIEEQIKRNVKQKFDLLTAAAFLHCKGWNRGRKCEALRSNSKREAQQKKLFETF